MMARPRHARHNHGVNLPINLIDLAAASLLVIAAYLGWGSGALPQVLGLVGAAAGLVSVIALASFGGGLLDQLDPPIRAFVTFGGAFLLVATAEAIGSTAGGALRDRLGRGVANRVDAAAGAVFSIAQALVLCWLVGGLLAAGPIPSLAREAQRSLAVRAMLSVLPPPSEVAGDLGSLIDASGLPEVFSGLEPLPAAPVAVPSSAAAAAIADPAKGSVVRIDAQACSRLYSGTGFSIAPGYVATNAHVVAGASRVEVTGDTSSTRVRGTVVLFDPELDVAVIRTPGMVQPALTFAAKAPARGIEGAALGHPNGGSLTVIPLAISTEVRARGRDLYGTQTVIRNVLELRATVEPGDSGGPIVLENGSVGGMVFAQSRTDPLVGYALDPVDVSQEVMTAVGSSVAVDLGACLR